MAAIMHDADLLVQIYTDAFSKGDVDAACACFASDAVIDDLLHGTLSSARSAWTELISAFCIQLQIDALCTEKSVVVARYREQGKFVAVILRRWWTLHTVIGLVVIATLWSLLMLVICIAPFGDSHSLFSPSPAHFLQSFQQRQ